MSTRKWNPLQDLVDFAEAMSILMGETVSARIAKEHFSRVDWVPVADFFEMPQQFLLRAELSGMESNDIIVEIQEDRLIIRGERKFQRDMGEETYHRIERSFGKFYREFPLSEEVDASKAKATYRNGLLEVVVPKLASSTAREIKVISSPEP